MDNLHHYVSASYSIHFAILILLAALSVGGFFRVKRTLSKWSYTEDDPSS